MMADLCAKPFVNMESAVNHPCQALADWKTMDDLAVPQRGKFVLSWVQHPRALPLAVPAAAVHMAAQRGMEVVVLRPEGYALPDALMAKARAAAADSGGTVTETTDRAAAMQGAHVLYAKEWGSPAHYGHAEGEANLRASLNDWCVNEDWFRGARQDCHFMHCLPVRRNVAVADAILDGPRSKVVREAANRMVVQMAVLYRLLKG
jgi:N-acetylornithine carbamoyltransferase